MREIDDRQPAHRQSDAVAEIESVIIRTAMTDGIVHAREQVAVDRRAITTNDACYATHLFSLFQVSCGRGQLLKIISDYVQ